MTCEELKALAASYALGALDKEEIARAEAHLDDALAHEDRHDGCLAAVRDANEQMAAMAKALVPVRPRAEVWLEIDRLVEKRETPSTVSSRRPLRSSWLIAAAAACALFSVFQWTRARSARSQLATTEASLAAVAVTEQRARLDCLSSLGVARHQVELQQKAIDSLAMSGTEIVAFGPKTEITAPVRALFNKKAKSAFVIVHNLHAVTDKDYALWIIRGEQKLAAGLVRPNAQGSAIVEVASALLEGPVDAFAITREKAGGAPVPEGPLLYLGSPQKG
jgi:anti-sigma-K factor RskA